jgi:hypothetical protein
MVLKFHQATKLEKYYVDIPNSKTQGSAVYTRLEMKAVATVLMAGKEKKVLYVGQAD